MKIIRASEPIAVEHPVFCIFGQPGIGKSSIGFSAKDPLLLDFDSGAHRAANRRDTLSIATWDDVVELMDSVEALESYTTIVVDTVGRCLDLMEVDIVSRNPKHGRAGGGLSLQGFGALKSGFRSWMTKLRAMGKDVVLISHLREDKDGDVVTMRPDIIGASYGEVMKISDYVGYLSMVGRQRVLDFSPTEKWVGKNPANWKPLNVPAIDKAQDFLGRLISDGREALGAISAGSAIAAKAVDDWRMVLSEYLTAEDLNKALPQIIALPVISGVQVKRLLMDRAKALNCGWDATKKAFGEAVPA